MQLTELTLIMAEEAALNRDSLLAGATALTTLASNEANQPLLDEAAFTYADFCSRSSQATESLGLSGLAWVASSLAHMLAPPMPDSVQSVRAGAAQLLTHWPDFFMSYLDGWSQGNLAQVDIGGLLVDLAQAKQLVLLDEDQLRELESLLKSPPSMADQQAAFQPKFELPNAQAMSLQIPEDSDADILDGILAEGPAQIEQLSNIVAEMVAGQVSAARLELAHRNAHTLKGTASMCGVRGIATLAHALEDVLEVFRREDFTAPAGLHQVLAASCDQLDLALNHLAHKTPITQEFELVTCQLHAWASHLQGIEVPPDLLLGDDAALRLNRDFRTFEN